MMIPLMCGHTKVVGYYGLRLHCLFFCLSQLLICVHQWLNMHGDVAGGGYVYRLHC